LDLCEGGIFQGFKVNASAGKKRDAFHEWEKARKEARIKWRLKKFEFIEKFVEWRKQFMYTSLQSPTGP